MLGTIRDKYEHVDLNVGLCCMHLGTTSADYKTGDKNDYSM